MTRAGLPRWRAALQAMLLATTGALAASATAAPPLDAPRFDPPREQSLILARTVVRELPGGAAIVATRRYRVSFRPVDGGWQVDGALISSEIEAPPLLAAIAALERDRPDDGMFPIMLDHSGKIIAEPTAGMGRAAVGGAVAAAIRTVGQAGASAPADEFLTHIGAAAASPKDGITRWPEDLFLPHGPNGASEQEFALPGGGAGSVAVSLASDPAPGMATMGHAARIVVTQAAGTRRVAREEWTLSPIGSPPKH